MMENLSDFLKGLPGVIFTTPTSPNYNSAKATYITNPNVLPLGIVRPQTAQDVAAIVSYVTANKIQFVIRSGGNNFFGLSSVHDALMIDMRDINFCAISDTKSSAKIGGGILNRKLVEDLSQVGLIAPIGSVPFVGYVGWAVYGGYGQYAINYGLGVDGILGAKIVNSNGEIVEADEQLLKGIRGAGGFAGVIVELTIKVYPLTNILAGMLVFDSFTNKALHKYNAGYQKLQAENDLHALSLSQVAMVGPHGKAFAILFLWSSNDEEKGREYLTQVEQLGNVVMNTVSSTTVLGYLESLAKIVPSHAHGTIRSLNLRALTTEVLEVITTNLEAMPSSKGTALVISELRGSSATPKESSIFAAREPHFLFELLATTAIEEDVKESKRWIDKFYNDLQGTDPQNILTSSYISLTPPEKVDMRKIYGEHFETLVELKKKYDPNNVFNLAVPRM